MINFIKESYYNLPPSEKALVRGVGYVGSSLAFGCFTLLSGRVAAMEGQPALYIFEGVSFIATVETAKKAWRSFQEGCKRD